MNSTQVFTAYHPFGTGKVRIVPVTTGNVVSLNNQKVTGTLKECLVFPEPEGSFTKRVLTLAGFDSLKELADYWQDPENSTGLRTKIANLLFQRAHESYHFFFLETWVLGNGAISVIVGDSAGMLHARAAHLVPYWT